MLTCFAGCSQICAVLAAVTEVIRSRGGKESETEYFAALVSAGCVEEVRGQLLLAAWVGSEEG